MKRLKFSLYKRRTESGKASRKKVRIVYYARFYDEAERRYVRTVSTGESTKARAEKVASDMLERGVVAPEDDPVLIAYVKEFWTPESAYVRLRDRQGRPLSARYIQLNADVVRLHAEPFGRFGTVRVSQITPGIVDSWVEWTALRHVGIRTTNIALQALVVPVRYWATAHRLTDPLLKYPKLKENPIRRGVLSVPELFALRDVRDKVDPRCRVAVLLAGFCGLRLGETRGLTHDDIDLEGGKLWVRRSVPTHTDTMQAPKSGSYSTEPIPVPDFVVEGIRELIAASPFGQSGLVLNTADDPMKPINDDLLKKHFRIMLREIGIDDGTRKARRISFHSLRHVAVSFWRYIGLEDFIAQAYARHKTARMTESYTHGEIIDFEDARRRIADATKAEERRAAEKQ